MNLSEKSDKTLAIKSVSSVNDTDMRDVKLLSLAQVRDLLGLGRHSLEQLINSNNLRTITIGHRRLVSFTTLRAYIAEQEEKSAKEGNYGY